MRREAIGIPPLTALFDTTPPPIRQQPQADPRPHTSMMLNCAAAVPLDDVMRRAAGAMRRR
jgi:hypothetical protein